MRRNQNIKPRRWRNPLMILVILAIVTLGSGLLAIDGGNWLSKLSQNVAADAVWTAGAPPSPDSSYGDYHTFIAVPDSQFMIDAATPCPGGTNCSGYYNIVGPTYSQYPPMLTSWILANKNTENIEFVMSMGDIVNNGGRTYGSDNSVTQWDPATEMYDPLFGEIPLSPLIGNHDYDAGSGVLDAAGYRSGLTNFNAAFPYSKWASSQNAFGGAFESGHMENVYYRTTVDGTDYLIMALEYQPRNEVLVWADGVLSTYPEDTVILTTHSYMNAAGNLSSTSGTFTGPDDNYNVGRSVYDNLVKLHPNVLLVLSGHVSSDLASRVDTGIAGNYIYSYLVDLQGYEQIGLRDNGEIPYGAILLIRVAEDGTKAQLTYYSTVRNQYSLQTEVQLKEPQPTVTVTQPSSAANIGTLSATTTVNGAKLEYSFNGGNWTEFDGEMTAAAVGAYAVRVAADQTNKINASDSVLVTVSPYNDPPQQGGNTGGGTAAPGSPATGLPSSSGSWESWGLSLGLISLTVAAAVVIVVRRRASCKMVQKR